MPRRTNWGRHFELWEDDIDQICAALTGQKYRAVCLNDSKTDIDFDMMQSKLDAAFNRLHPSPSAFER